MKEVKLVYLYIQVMLVVMLLIYSVLFKVEDIEILINFMGQGISVILSTASFLVVVHSFNKGINDRTKIMGICGIIMSLFIGVKCIYEINVATEYIPSHIHEIFQSIMGIIFLMICTSKNKKSINLYISMISIISIIGMIVFILSLHINLNIYNEMHMPYIKAIVFICASLVATYRLIELNKGVKIKEVTIDSMDIQTCIELCMGSILVWILMALSSVIDMYVFQVLRLVIEIILSLIVFRYIEREAFIIKSKRIKKSLEQNEKYAYESGITQDILFASAIQMNNRVSRMNDIVERITSKIDINDINNGSLYIEKIHRNCKILSKLSDNIIRLNNFENRDYKIDFQTVDIVSVIKESVDSLIPYFKSNNIELEYDIRFRNIYCEIGIEELERILINIVSNSIKYTKGGGKVVISVNKDCREVEIQVRDNGVGIDSKDLENIFSRFSRYSTKGQKNEEGSGLGLAIVKNLVELHNGDVEIKSSLGDGTVVYIRLPIKQ